MSIPLKCLPGRVAVLWNLSKDNDFIEIPEWVRIKGEQCRQWAWDCRWCEVVSSGRSDIRKGDWVAVRADAANMGLEPIDYPWVPKGFEIRIYGVTEPIHTDEWEMKWREGYERPVPVPDCIMGIMR